MRSWRLLWIVAACALHLDASAEITGAAKTTEFDFSGVRAGDVAIRQVAFSNAGDKELAIKSVNVSCSCTRVLGYSKSIAAKSSGTVLVEFRPTKPGRFDIEMLIETDWEKDAVVAMNWAGDVAAADKGARPSETASRDGMMATMQEVAAMGANTSAMLVDTREPAEFDLCHIDGSVNWQVRMLREMGSFKGKKIVLIGKGNDDESAVRDALTLRAAGFAATQVLQGGLRAWAQAHKPMSGSGVGSIASAMVKPQEFFGTRQDEWLVVDFAPSPRATGEGIPGAVHIAMNSDAEKEFGKLLASEVQKRGALFRVLVVSGGGEGYENIEKSLPVNDSALVFYLDGGLRAYRQFVQQHIAMLNRREMKVSTGPAGRTGLSGTMPDSGGCASCPKKASSK